MDFSVAGSVKLRQFLQLLAACTKMSETFFFEPLPQALLLRAVNESQSAHFLAEIPCTVFEAYQLQTSPPHQTSQQVAQPLNIQVVSRAIAASVLRFCPLLVRLSVHFNPSESQDRIIFTMFSHNGVTKVFELGVGEVSVSDKADITGTDAAMHFRAVAEPKTWGGLLSLLPPSTKSLCVAPSMHRLTVSENTSQAGDAASNGVVVSADPKSFLSYTLTFPQGSPSHHAAVTFPHKTVEAKALRWFFTLAEALSLNVRISTGGLGQPVQVDVMKRPTAAAAPGGASWYQHGGSGGGVVAPGDSGLAITTLSLLLAAIDGIDDNAAKDDANKRRPSGALHQQERSQSRFPLSAGDAVVSVATAVSSGDLVAHSTTSNDFGMVRETSQSCHPLAGPSHTGSRSVVVGDRGSSVASMVAPSFSDLPATGSSSSSVAGVGSTPPMQVRKRERSEDMDHAGGQTGASSIVPGSAARSEGAQGIPTWQPTNGLDGAVEPLDFFALHSDDEDDEDYALEQFLALRPSQPPPSLMPQHISTPASGSTGSHLCAPSGGEQPAVVQLSDDGASSRVVASPAPSEPKMDHVVDFASILCMVPPSQ